jgi:endonuclease/exonuclease/phosphatase family metal-dependent hydrolase
LLAGLGWAPLAHAQTASPVIWNGLVNVIPIGPNNNGLQKNGGCGGCQDAGAFSQQSITLNGYLEFTAPATTAEIYVGFTTGDGSGLSGSFPWTIHLSAIAIAEIRENGGYKGEWTYAAGDTFRITVTNGVVTYTHNGTGTHTSDTNATTPVKIDTLLQTLNGSVANVLIAGATPSGPEPIVWTGLTRVTPIGTNNNGLKKTSGSNGSYDAGAYSQQSIASGDGYLEFTASNTTSDAVIGLTTGDGSGTGASFPWGIHLSTVGIAEVRENGGYKTDTVYAAGDVFRISIASGVVTYQHNGTTFHTSETTASYPLKVDTSLSTLNGQFENGLISTSAAPPPPPAVSVKVLTWNIQKGTATDGSDSITDNSIAGFISAFTQADVLLLSAVETENEALTIASQLHAADMTKTWSVQWAKASDANEGQAIITHHDIVEGSKDSFEKSCPNDTENQVIVTATVRISGIDVNFFAVDQQHDDPGIDRSAVRQCQAQAFIAWADDVRFAQPHIVGGDFNASSDVGITTWTSSGGYFDGWTQAAAKNGYPNEGISQGNNLSSTKPFGRTKKNLIDHILTRPLLTYTEAHVWDARKPGTTCNSVLTGDFLGPVCGGDCSTCEYVDDKRVRPTDHIPLTVIIRIQ